jgi:hypoxanthine phosphoribosyltransferase
MAKPAKTASGDALSPEAAKKSNLPADPASLLQGSTVLATAQEVQDALSRMAAAINAHYGGRPIVLLVVMTGAMMPAAWLATRLKMPLVLDFVHATRYDGATEGGEIRFRVAPRFDLAGEDVLVVEDIFDVGLTLQAITRYCREQGARSVRSAVLVRKIHERATTGDVPDFIGLDVEDRYIFGCGMDVHEHWRHLEEIRALEQEK